MRLATLLGAFVSLLLLANAPGQPTAEANADLLKVVSHVTYDLRPDTGPVRVTWHVTLENEDPQTEPSNGVFYRNISLPVLAGVSSLSAISSDGDVLEASVDNSSEAVLVPATVEFSEPVFYQDQYVFDLTYELANVREPSVLVTPNYVYVPIIAAGDEATIVVNTPPDPAWPATLEAQAGCTQEGNTFRCAGSESSYLAATAEVSQPSATTTTGFEVPLREARLAVNVSFFLGEEAFAQHLNQLATAALPLIEAEMGFPYRGAAGLTITQGGRQSVLGYEGLTSCDANGCHVTVSPGAHDVTIIHELAHLWSGIYEERWLAEGFAQFVAEDVAAQLPGLVQGGAPQREPSSVSLALDEWNPAAGVIGASEQALAVEAAGYELSLRFLYQLRFETGTEALRSVNAAIAAGGVPVNSREYLDAFEDTSGRKVDGLFGDWVFDRSYDSILTQRREARERLAALNASLADAGLTTTALETIQQHIAAWRFGDALTQLDSAEQNLETYFEISEDVDAFRLEANNAGLSVPPIAEEELAAWRFSDARFELERARLAMNSYVRAAAVVQADRTLLEKFGLLAKDPEEKLDASAAAFAAGEFDRSRTLSDDARQLVEGSDTVAMRRFAIVFGIAGLFAIVVLGAVWLSRNREHEFA